MNRYAAAQGSSALRSPKQNERVSGVTGPNPMIGLVTYWEKRVLQRCRRCCTSVGFCGLVVARLFLVGSSIPWLTD